jgi:hypothetical protein
MDKMYQRGIFIYFFTFTPSSLNFAWRLWPGLPIDSHRYAIGSSKTRHKSHFNILRKCTLLVINVLENALYPNFYFYKRQSNHKFLYYHSKGPFIFFIIITSVQRVLFSQPLSPLKVYKSSEKNDDGVRFHEIKHGDPGS